MSNGFAGVPKDLNFSLENLVLIFRPSFERQNSSKELSVYCPESALVLLHMLRKVINEVCFSLSARKY